MVIFEQVFILFVFAAIGYVLSKSGIIKSEHSKVLSGLLVYVFLPSNIFKTFAVNVNGEYMAKNSSLLLTSAGILIVLAAAAHFAGKMFSKKKYEQSIYEYSLVVPNYGYMGYALAESIFGTAGLADFMVFALPTSLYIYTYGFCILTKREFSLKKLFNPVIIATVLGLAAGFAKLNIPNICMEILDKSSNCMAPVSMLLAGITVSEFKFKEIASDMRNYVVSVIRLVVTPLILSAVLSLFLSKEIVQTAVLMYSLPCGMNTIVFPKLVSENCKIGAGLALISTVLACITIPVLFMWR